MHRFFLLLNLLCSALTFKLTAKAAYAQLSSLVTQVPESGRVSYAKTEVVNEILNMELDEKKEAIIIKEPGIYLLISSVQVGSANQDTIGYVDYWLVKNDKPVTNSNSRMTIDELNSTGVLTTQLVIMLQPGDRIKNAYAASGPAIGFVFFQPENEPAIPSLIVTVLKISDIETEKANGPQNR